MPRIPNPDQANSDERYIIQEMVRVLRSTTEEERLTELNRWCEGNREWYYQWCHDRDITPIAFILVSMVEVNHPFICEDENTLKYSITGCMTEIIKAEMYEKVVHMTLCTTKEVVHIVHSEDEAG